ncbi:PRC-barrel domain-containing protein [Microvirga rosea]|uniref:PRC-barrel domain-containing protein n=1 Tax=Microvirga rosea TaxID=2715425 RepID=UPI001D0AB626|nr:PRC-barrel domain-containing protein [Microvirga rosea]MCB8820171.1 PRC-barrel domain-containing protein [Microvirga rosea]
MLKKHMAACLVATLFAAPAFAQTSAPGASGATDRPAATGSGSTTTGSPAMQPGNSGSSSMNSSSMSTSGSSTMAQSSGMQGQFMTQMQANQMMASDLIGTRVISANNESIGDINDVIVDRNGQAVAAVVGVGGFLGIGEKDVAVPFNSLEFATREQVNAMNNADNSGNKVSTTGSTASNTTAGTSSTTNNNAVNATGSTNTTSGTSASSNSNEPERVILRMTKAELQAAPKFDKNAHSGATGSAAPKQ